jgi:carbamoylphosphate synthase large subunit
MKKLKIFILLTFYLFSIASCFTNKNYIVSDKGNVVIRKVKHENGQSRGFLKLTLINSEDLKDTVTTSHFKVNGIDFMALSNAQKIPVSPGKYKITSLYIGAYQMSVNIIQEAGFDTNIDFYLKSEPFYTKTTVNK